MDKTFLIAITGPSGFRKTEIVKRAIREHDRYTKVISYTDRPKFPDETEDTDFHFVTEEKFTEMIDNEEFIEWQRLSTNGYRFGKTKEEFNETLKSNPGKVVFTQVNIINLPVLKRYYPEMCTIFVDVKDTKAMEEYLKQSNDIPDEDEYERRYKFAIEERRRRHLADFIINMKDDEEETYQEFLSTVQKCVDKMSH